MLFYHSSVCLIASVPLMRAISIAPSGQVELPVPGLHPFEGYRADGHTASRRELCDDVTNESIRTLVVGKAV
jgi:hypothetical protein